MTRNYLYCLISIYCIFVSSQNISSRDTVYILNLKINPSKIYHSKISFIYEELKAFEDKDSACMLPYFHLQLMDKTGKIKYMDFNYTFPEAVCPINMDILPLIDNHVIIVYLKSNNGVKGKYNIIINYSNESINLLVLKNQMKKVSIATWRWFSILPDITTGEVVERKNGDFYTPNLLSYTLVYVNLRNDT
ncbi:hypothetical protein RhiirA4_548828 [Rhizophagus irregularis]|uniref:Uncharacterized protein n=1 Tax=Rhizophagus irregularis TaxID=588596 RepID=A0A2I1H9R2_9GLOM|nr:hypothetical protein RhiirA4_548828 [Rhizophagus irregularis]